MSTAPVSACPTCGGWLRLGTGHGPFRNFCRSECIRIGQSSAPYNPRRTPLGPIPGRDPLEVHFGDHATTTPMIPISDWPIAVGDVVTTYDGRRGRVTRCRWLAKHIDRDAVWESCVDVRIDGTSKVVPYRMADLSLATEGAPSDA